MRGYPAGLLDWLQSVPGDRFEYELDLLLRASRDGDGVEAVPIETVYLEGNASSHLRTVNFAVNRCLVFARGGRSRYAQLPLSTGPGQPQASPPATAFSPR